MQIRATMLDTGRVSGVLLPLFSLRSRDDFGIGDFGAIPAWLRFLRSAGQRLWMTLPLLPTARGDVSPYATRSAFGLNPLFIHLESIPEYRDAGGVSTLSEEERWLLEEARAAHRVKYASVFRVKWAALWTAFRRFEERGTDPGGRFEAYRKQSAVWLDSYSLYAALAEDQEQRPWWEWPRGVRERQPQALSAAVDRLGNRVRFHSWLQFVAQEQWNVARAFAREQGVLLAGDEPFIIGQDSADTWANPHYLRRDARLGVPPDEFSDTGQDWGLPYFDFQAMEKDDWGWLRLRALHAAAVYDLRRVDHAVGYFRQYIRDEKTPRGRFLPLEEPLQRRLGTDIFRLLSDGSGIVAEDLGVIPPFVRQTLAELQIPGYRVLRWEKDEQVYRDPHAFPEVSLVTTGTHDTETLREWWEAREPAERLAAAEAWPEFEGMRPPPAEFTPEVHTRLLATAENAASRLCVVPWQDVLGETERINLPGSVQDANWAYRITAPVEELDAQPEVREAAARLRTLTQAAHRLSGA
ncbi:MAG: 4-alpha-glucanotransferase [Myxococcaceae bacterium]